MYIDNPIGNTPDNGDNTDNNFKTVLFEETVTTAQQGEFPVAQAELAYSQYIDADTIYVTFDGTTYTCQKRHDDEEGANYYGAPTVDGRVDFSTIPFSISSNSTNENYIATQIAGTHTVKVEVEGSGGGGASFGNYVNIDMGTDEPSDYMGGDAVPVDRIYAGDYPPAGQMTLPDNIIATFNMAALNMAVEGTSLNIPLGATKTVQAVYLRTITGLDEQSGYIIEQTAYTSYEVRTGFGGNKFLALNLANIPAPYEGDGTFPEIYIKYSN